ncbi:MAG: choice-of-anchor J domain-containing protein, partial [Caulobacteraceae bacterium]
FIQSLAKDTDNGIESVNKILEEYNAGIDFEELFRRFTVALAIDSDNPGDGIYSFDTIDIKLNYDSAATFNKPGVPAWGADYISMEDTGKIKSILFDGINFMPVPWIVADDPTGNGDQVLWGNQGDEVDNMIIFEADLTNVNAATLKFDHLYDIEEAWDYGLVQVSTDNGNSWTSLANADTRSDLDPDGYPAISEKLPGFTGTIGEWTTEEFDLSSYAGNKILVAFRYMTDWGTNGAGWYIKNIEVPEIGLVKDASNLDEFMSIDEVLGITVDYAVAFINEKTAGKSGNSHIKVLNIDPFNISEEDAITLRGYMNNGDNHMIVWYAAPAGKKGSVDYSYELQYRGNNIKDTNGNGHGGKGGKHN